MRQLETKTGAERGATVASKGRQLTWRKAVFLICSLGAFVALFALAGGASAMRETASVAPSIVSDKPDYNPGAMVTLNGAGWGADETVHIAVNDDKDEPWSYATDVAADAAGGFTTQFQLPMSFAATYFVQATGSSGASATTTFTDGNVNTQDGRRRVGISDLEPLQQHQLHWKLDCDWVGSRRRPGQWPSRSQRSLSDPIAAVERTCNGKQSRLLIVEQWQLPD